ncbi:hypothetical protein NLML1_0516 [Candidatus Nanosynbacter lyticus]|nr:hypothetical protein NLML1_0516 [Candidatus Nanosynbacter lyticus]
MRTIIIMVIPVVRNQTIVKVGLVVLRALLILVIDITILAIQMKAKMMYIMLIALKLVRMVQSQYGKVNLAIGKSLTEMAMA